MSAVVVEITDKYVPRSSTCFIFMALNTAVTSPQRRESRESWNLCNGFNATKTTPAMMAIMAITIKSSINVNPAPLFCEKAGAG